MLVEMEKLRNLNSGLGQFCFHLGNAFSKINPADMTIQFYLPKQLNQLFGSAFEYKYRRLIHKLIPADSREINIWHCTHQLSQYLPSSKQTKLIVTIHDLNFIRKYSGTKQRMYLNLLQKKIDRCSAIAVISKFTEAELREHIKVPNIPVRLIYIGTSLIRFNNPLKPYFAPPGKFLFSIGIISPKKNLHVLVPVLKELKNLYLVLAGSNDSDYAQAIRMEAVRLDISDRIIMPGQITDEEKYWMFMNCAGLVFPSLSEGFGSPVIEAMSCGKPVFLSRFTSLPEIGGDDAYYFDGFGTKEMARVIEHGLDEFNSDPDAPKRSIDHASQFSWENAAQQYLQLYREIM